MSGENFYSPKPNSFSFMNPQAGGPLKSGTFSLMDANKTQGPGYSTSLSSGQFSSGMGQAENWGLGDTSIEGAVGDTPKMGGGWMEAGEFGLGVAKVGLGIYSALQQSKMNKFMRKYYGDQMELQKADFANNARSTNEALQERQARRLSARGQGAIGSATNQAGVSSYMDRWGVDETV